ncbi:MAG: triose-phosphate isomerase [Acidobacteriota bacterium]
MRIPFVAANFKMFKTAGETFAYVQELRELVSRVADVEIVVAPPFLALPSAVDAAGGSRIGIAAQDLHWEREGAFTGEVSAAMIKDAGAGYVLIGHSERRRLFGETGEVVHKKLMAALGADLTAIVCIGETLDERDGNRTTEVLDRQLDEALAGLTAPQAAGLVVAYEPVWAIGTGRNATPEQAGDAHAHIRGWLRERFTPGAAEQCHILYGGSVKPDNIRELMALPDVDGALVGGASLRAQSFFDIITGCRR